MSKKSNVGAIIIGGILIVGGAIGAYLYFKKRKQNKQEDQVQVGEDSQTSVETATTSTSSGSGGSSSSSSSSTGNPFKSKSGVKKFQEWVINTKKDSSILGSSGADGIWGSKTANAYAQYGDEYNQSVRGGGSASTSKNPVPTANDFAALKNSMKPELGNYPLTEDANWGVTYKFKTTYDKGGKPQESVTGSFLASGVFQLKKQKGGQTLTAFNGSWWYQGNRLYISLQNGASSNGTYTPDVVLRLVNAQFQLFAMFSADGKKPYTDAQDSIL